MNIRSRTAFISHIFSVVLVLAVLGLSMSEAFAEQISINPVTGLPDVPRVSAEEVLSEPKFMVTFGIGYSSLASLGLQASAGFNVMKYFAVSADFDFSIGLDSAFDFSVVPKFQYTIDEHRLALGMGFGLAMDSLFSVSEKRFIDFVLKPQFQYYWIGSKHLLLGFAIDWLVQFRFHKEMRFSREEKYTETKGSKMYLTFQVGYIL